MYKINPSYKNKNWKEDSRKRDKFVSSRDSRFNTSSRVYDVKCSLDWLLMKTKIRDEFIQAKCWPLVGPLPQPVQDVIRNTGLAIDNGISAWRVSHQAHLMDSRRYYDEMNTYLQGMNQHTQALVNLNQQRALHDQAIQAYPGVLAAYNARADVVAYNNYQAQLQTRAAWQAADALWQAAQVAVFVGVPPPNPGPDPGAPVVVAPPADGVPVMPGAFAGVAPDGVGSPPVPAMPPPPLPDQATEWVDVDGNPVNAAREILETLFNVEKPLIGNNIVINKINTAVSEVNAVYAAMIAKVVVGQNFADQFSASRAIFDLENKRDQAILEHEQSGDRIAARLEAGLVAYTKELKDYTEMQGSALKVFNTSMSAGMLSVIKNELKNLRFRAAWVKLNLHFATSVGGTENISDILSAITTAKFDHSIHTIAQHIEILQTLAEELEKAGEPPVTNNMMLEFILSSIERGSSKVFQKDVEDIRRRKLTLLDAQELFQSTASKHYNKVYKSPVFSGDDSTDRDSNGKRSHRESASAAEEEEQEEKPTKYKRQRSNKSEKDGAGAGAALAALTALTKTLSQFKVTNPSSKEKCGTCGRQHPTKNCWFTSVCGSCGQTGHVDLFCPKKTGKAPPANTKQVRMLPLFKAKV